MGDDTSTPKEPLWIRFAQIQRGRERGTGHLAIVLAFCFAAFNAFGTYLYVQTIELSSAPTVTARITDRSISRSSGKSSSTNYHVYYTYTVDGVTYEQMDSVGSDTYDSLYLQKTVEAHVDPARPDISTIDVAYGERIGGMSLACFGSAFVLSIYLVFASRAARRIRREDD